MKEGEALRRPFMEIIQGCRARVEREGGVAADEVQRKFGRQPNSGDG